MTRMPCNVKFYKGFKASTWRIWLLFVSVPALSGKLKPQYFQHWILLVAGITILLQDVITETEIQLAEQLLTLFVRDTEVLYGLAAMTYNMHGLTHLGLVTRRWGGLWATSTFRFEGVNGLLTRLLHGKQRVSTELTNTLNLVCAADTLAFLLRPGASFQVSQKSRLLTACDYTLTEREMNLFVAECGDPKLFDFFARASIRRQVYTSEMYTAQKVMDNKTVCYVEGGVKEYGVVKVFFKNGNESFAVLQKFHVCPDTIFKHDETGVALKHIISVTLSEALAVVLIEHIVYKVLRVNNFLCEEPNHFERVL